MKKSATLAIVGGDLRQAELARMLNKDGHNISVYALERQSFDNDIKQIHDLRLGFSDVDAVILPMPTLQDEFHINTPLSNASHKFSTILDAINEKKYVFGGSLSSEIKHHAKIANLKTIDYLKRPELAILNAIPSVEGALQIAMEQMLTTLHGSNSLVIGNGRIGKLLAQRLQSMGAKVSVSARNYVDFAHIETYGYTPLDTRNLSGNLGEFDVIFNTVPVLVLGVSELTEIKKECLIIDLASKPGGVDFNSANKLSKNAIWALSLPGKVAPLTSAKIIRNTITNILVEEGIL